VVRKTAMLGALALGFCALVPASAQAQNFHTWVSRSGANTDVCGAITAPCRTFFHALARTVAGGQIQCVDAVDEFGSTSIGKSITVKCDGMLYLVLRTAGRSCTVGIRFNVARPRDDGRAR
jgi:hypothetical protein